MDHENHNDYLKKFTLVVLLNQISQTLKLFGNTVDLMFTFKNTKCSYKFFISMTGPFLDHGSIIELTGYSV